jgi:hypothetical protein
MRRFPRLQESNSQGLRPECIDDKLKRAALENRAFQLLTRRRELRIELGRVFLQIKEIVGHGRWESYFTETFAVPFDITLRTGENYMKGAREYDGGSKNENLSDLEPATDRGARKMKEATQRAQEIVGPSRIFKLPLLLTADEQTATSRLLKSRNWPKARREITTLVIQLSLKLGTREEEKHENPLG